MLKIGFANQGSIRYYGPFLVEDCIGQVAYCLHLLDSLRIHPMFHISFLKLHQGPLPTRPANLPPTTLHHHPIIEPLSILDWKWGTLPSTQTKLILVQWSSLSPKDTTWEQWDTLRTSYNLGQGFFSKRGN